MTEPTEHISQLEDHVERTSRALESLRRRATEIDHPTLDEALEQLTTTLEELHVSAEELSATNQELQAVQGELEDERQRYAGLFHRAPEAYLVTDPNGVIKEANDRASRMLARSPDELARKPLVLFVADGDRRAFQTWLNQLRAGSVSAGREVTLEPDDGPPLVVAVRVEAERDATGTVTTLRWQLHDMTDVREAQAALQTTYAEKAAAVVQLRELDRWKNAFLAAAAHDLRSPLMAMYHYGERISEQAPLDAQEQDRIGRRIRTSAEYLLSLLSDLLDLDRVTRGEVRAQRTPTEIDDLVREVLDRIDTADHEVTLDVPAMTVHIDRARVSQILTNLVRNAIVHTPPGTHVRICVERDRTTLRLIVEDDGYGIPDEIATDLFAPFTTQVVHRYDTKGTGIGLTLVELFAELHGGTARSEPREGGGAKLVVELPDAVPDAVPEG